MEFFEVEDKEDTEIIYDLFDLNNLQQQIFETLEEAELTVQEIADEVDRNRSTVQRALQEMLDKELIFREGKTDRTVYYVYTTLPMDDVKELTAEALDEWHSKVKAKL